jgi:hypothetical protein
LKSEITNWIEVINEAPGASPLEYWTQRGVLDTKRVWSIAVQGIDQKHRIRGIEWKEKPENASTI